MDTPAPMLHNFMLLFNRICTDFGNKLTERKIGRIRYKIYLERKNWNHKNIKRFCQDLYKSSFLTKIRNLKLSDRRLRDENFYFRCFRDTS